MDAKILGQRIRIHRRLVDIPQYTLARRLGVSLGAIMRIERGEASSDDEELVRVIAQTLSVPTDDARGDAPVRVMHALAYWFSVSVLTPLSVLVGFFNRRGQLLHDLLLGTVLVNTAATVPPGRSF